MAETRSEFENNMQMQINELRKTTHYLKQDLEKLSDNQTRINAEFSNFIWLTIIDVDFNKAHTRQFIPIRIYFEKEEPNWEDREELFEAVSELLLSVGFYISIELPERKGSWFKEFIAKSKELLSRREVTDRIGHLEEALKIKHLRQPQAEANNTHADALVKVLGSLTDAQDACIQVGTLLVVKASLPEGRRVFAARTLSDAEIKRLEEDPSILRRPLDALEMLKEPVLISAPRVVGEA
jgi:hypothetical protein